MADKCNATGGMDHINEAQMHVPHMKTGRPGLGGRDRERHVGEEGIKAGVHELHKDQSSGHHRHAPLGRLTAHGGSFTVGSSATGSKKMSKGHGR